MPSEGGTYSCIYDPEEVFIPVSFQERASEIFHGKIISIDGNNVKFEVIDIYKGVDEKSKVVDTHSARNYYQWSRRLLLEKDENTLHRSAKIGDEWLIYGHKNSKRKIDKVKEITGDEITPDSLYVYYKSTGPCMGYQIGTRPYNEVTMSAIIQLYIASYVPGIYIKYALNVFNGLVIVAIFFLQYWFLSSFLKKSNYLSGVTSGVVLIFIHALISNIGTGLIILIMFSIILIPQLFSRPLNKILSRSIGVLSFLGTLIIIKSIAIFGFGFRYASYEDTLLYLIINNHITVIIMMVLPIFLTIFILFKIYKYFKKRRGKVAAS